MPGYRTVAELLADAISRLAGKLGLPTRETRLEARLLAGHVFGVGPAWLLAHDTDRLGAGQTAQFETVLARRLAGEPVAYILGEREFYGRAFRVTPATLIPRPETEHLVEAALTRAVTGAGVLDIGTGSGCIAVTLKLERPDLCVTAVDSSADALTVARDNGARLGAEVEWQESDLFAALVGRRFDMIVANPPYVAEADPHLDALHFEPRAALASGPDGLETIRRIVQRAPTYLAAGGWLLLEHGWDQSEAVRRLLATAGFGECFMERDLAGQTRVSGGRTACSGRNGLDRPTLT